jgi:pimeloyl-ACP methyl ester carboxylesterase
LCELVDWLTGIIDALKIGKAYMAGLSLGGFLVISYALEKSKRPKKIVLLAPATTFAPSVKADI